MGTSGVRTTAECEKLHLAALIRGKDRNLLAAFLLDRGTGFALNPFPSTTAGVVRLSCVGLAYEYPILGIQSAGLACLLRAVAALPKSTPLSRRILKSTAHTCTVFLTADGRCLGAYLHGKAGVPLPALARGSPRSPPRRRGARQACAGQLDLFCDVA